MYAASEPFDETATEKIIAKQNLMLAKFSEMGNILRDFKKGSKTKVCAALVGAGDVYFEAKKLFDFYEKI